MVNADDQKKKKKNANYDKLGDDKNFGINVIWFSETGNLPPPLTFTRTSTSHFGQNVRLGEW